MFSKDRKIEILTAEVERLRRENNILKNRDTKEIAKKAQEISDEYIKETQNNLDEIIELNYTFFGYVATHTYINNSSISYEDKFQSALLPCFL